MIGAFAPIHDIRELHARKLKPLLADGARTPAVLAEAEALRGSGAEAVEDHVNPRDA